MKYDIVIYGASGFTGGLVLDYLARQVEGSSVKLAIAGRNSDKLFKIKNNLVAQLPSMFDLGVIEADSGDYESLLKLAAQAKIIISTVGPYAKYGEELVKACIEQGTHCLDLSGEPNYVNEIYKHYDFPAERSGSLIINSCGFDSIPADLGAFYTSKLLGEGDRKIIQAYVSVKGSISGGTLLSALEFLEQRDLLSSDTLYKVGLLEETQSAHYQSKIKRWAIPMPVVDPTIVARSSRLRSDVYGDKFSYAQYIGLKKPLKAGGLFFGMGALLAGSRIPAIKERLLSWRGSGDGPTEQERANGYFSVTFIGKKRNQEVITRVSGGEPGYAETSKMISEVALLLLENPELSENRGGVHTPVSALGEKLLERLQDRGIVFEQL